MTYLLLSVYIVEWREVERPGGALDMTHPLMYYSAAWAWLEYMTRGPAGAEHVMKITLELVHNAIDQKDQSESSAVSGHTPVMDRSRGMLSGKLALELLPNARTNLHFIIWYQYLVCYSITTWSLIHGASHEYQISRVISG